MHWSGWLIYLVVVFWLLPGALISDAALILAVGWGLGEVVAWTGGNKLPLDLYLITDVISMALLWKLAVGKDRWIMAIFPGQWIAYACIDDLRALWWLLFWTTLAQMIIAGPWLAFGKNRTREGRRGLARGVS